MAENVQSKAVKIANPAAGGKRIIRIGDTDLDGDKSVLSQLMKIYGVNASYANALVNILDIDGASRLQDLNEEMINKLKDALINPQKYGIPIWLLNWQRELETGASKHKIGNELKSSNALNLQQMKLLRTYRGIRHQFGYKVRGQKTRSRGANEKGRIGKTIGVTKAREVKPAKE
ncbi:MAG: 30S ribosomal protein S13 [Candidatus Parvarchaeota archaeon]|nr:30S ribosomal protein S13 [Candidatus Parvarchaeota archaeon]MCW1301607.1 30S ribosomal protein S13 [Candidatus Parvarchaeota archaeon]